MKAAWEWVKAHWRVVLTGVVAVGGFILGGFLFGNTRRPDKTVKKALEASKAGEAAAKDAIDRGAEKAVELLEQQHADTIADLDAAQKAKYEALKKDPKALAAHLTRLSS